MNNIEDHILDLVLSYFEETITASESEELKIWLRKSGENRTAFLKMNDIWLSIKAQTAGSRFDSKAAHDRFRAAVAMRMPAGKPSLARNRWIYLAAGFALLLTVSASFFFGVGTVSASFADIAIESPAGSRTHLYLPDSTEVWLNAASSISYSQGFGIRERKVNLVGEAFFSVTKNPSKPFTVITEDGSVKVLGTKFNFRNYLDDKEMVVSLEEGKVAVSGKTGKEYYLEPNQKFTLDKESGRMSIVGTVASNASLWVNNLLFFDEEPLSDIAKGLERYYNVTISIDNPELRSYRFYCEFEKREMTIDDIIEVLSATGKVKCKKEGKHISLY